MISNISTEVVSLILSNNGMEPTTALLDSIVASYAGEMERVKKLYDRYQADNLPIMQKTVQNQNWSNYKLRANIEGHIVRLYAGFMNPYATSYTIPDDVDSSELLQEYLSKWAKLNTIEKVDAETLQVSCACGMAYLYVNQASGSLVNLRPYEIIPIYGMDAGTLDYALRYFSVNAYVEEDGKLTQKTMQCYEWYGPDKIIFYQKIDGAMQKMSETPNLLGACPVVMIRFNGNMESNYGDVIELCDAYRDILSVAADETVNIKWSILKLIGMSKPDDQAKDANGMTEADKFTKMIREAFALFIPNGIGQTGNIDAQWLTKPLPKEFIEFMLDKLYERILSLTQTFDPDYAGNNAVISTVTGPGMDFKLLNMKSKCMLAMTYFIDGMRKVLALECLRWSKLSGKAIDPTDIDITMSFNMPVDRNLEAMFLQSAQGVLSQQTALSLSLLVKDPQKEIAQIEQEKKERQEFYTDLDKAPNGQPADQTGGTEGTQDKGAEE